MSVEFHECGDENEREWWDTYLPRLLSIKFGRAVKHRCADSENVPRAGEKAMMTRSNFKQCSGI